jgi:DNA-binding transcriptional LysR family regulator
METITRHLTEAMAFHWVAAHRSFTLAAQEISISKAQVSKAVQRLEAVLGVQLLRRSTRSVELTDEGLRLFDMTSKIFHLAQDTAASLQGIKGGEHASFRISTPVSLGEVFFPKFIPILQTAVPGISIDADMTNEVRDLIRDRIDFSLRASEEAPPEAVSRYLGKLRDVIVASPKVARKMGGKDPRELSSTPCILASLESKWNHWVLSSPREEVKVQVTGRIATSQYGASLQFALQGFGVARIPYYLAMEDIATGRLISLYSDYQIATHPMHLIYLKGAYASPTRKKVRDLILKWFQDQKEIFI